ncbi:MAG: hypothetical protein ACXV2C_00750, partial [Candidatus Bathyarchaeia archaeon]
RTLCPNAKSRNMKMKVTWEEIDIEGGRLVVRNVPEPTTEDWWIISWRTTGTLYPAENVYGLTSLADGMALNVAAGTRQAVANWLNENDYHPAELYVMSDE